MIRQEGDKNIFRLEKLKRCGCGCVKNLKLKDRFIFFGQNSGIHGLIHLFANGAFILNRLFWLLILVASAGCLYLLLLTDERDDLNFTPDTLYLNWMTTFPAVTVCETYHARNMAKKVLELYPNYTKHLSLDFRKYLAAVMFGRGTCGKAVCVPCGDKVPCDLPFRQIAENVRLKCTELLSNCSFNGEDFPCCDNFHVVDSEYGPCYSLNTLQSEKSQLEALFRVNRSTGPGKLDFRISTDSEVAVHSPEELATLDLDPKFKFEVKLYMENRVKYFFSVVEIENEKVLTREDMSVRGCRYLEELPDTDFYKYPLYMENRVQYFFSVVEIENEKVLTREHMSVSGCRYLEELPDTDFYKYPVYGYGACKLSHSTEHLFEHCNCVHPIRHKAYESMFCNYTGINCIVVHEFEKTKLGVDKNAMEDDECLPSCVESELTTVHVSRQWINTDDETRGAWISVQMSDLPTLRFQRNLVTSNLDIVVNVGGMFSLFFGASIFSLVEIVYLIFRNI